MSQQFDSPTPSPKPCSTLPVAVRPIAVFPIAVFPIAVFLLQGRSRAVRECVAMQRVLLLAMWSRLHQQLHMSPRGTAAMRDGANQHAERMTVLGC